MEWRTIVRNVDDHRVFVLPFLLENLHETSHTAIQARDGLIVLRQFGSCLGRIGQVRRNRHIFVPVGHLLIAGERLGRISKAIWLAGMVFDPPTSPMGIVRAPIEEERLLAPDELAARFGHAYIIPPEFAVGVALLEREDPRGGIVHLANPDGAISRFIEQRGEGDHIVEACEVVLSVRVPVGSICVIVQSGEDHTSTGGTGGRGAVPSRKPDTILRERIQMGRLNG